MSGPGVGPGPDWERVIATAERLRLPRDTDHVLTDLRERSDDVLADLESVAGWTTARTRPPVPIRGSLVGIETGIRQLIRSEPLETVRMRCVGKMVTVPTLAETLRIKAVLILKRNALREYVDVVALGAERRWLLKRAGFRRFAALLPESFPSPWYLLALAGLASDIGFVGFHNALQKIAFSCQHCRTDTLLHIPC